MRAFGKVVPGDVMLTSFPQRHGMELKKKKKQKNEALREEKKKKKEQEDEALGGSEHVAQLCPAHQEATQLV